MSDTLAPDGSKGYSRDESLMDRGDRYLRIIALLSLDDVSDHFHESLRTCVGCPSRDVPSCRRDRGSVEEMVRTFEMVERHYFKGYGCIKSPERLSEKYAQVVQINEILVSEGLHRVRFSPRWGWVSVSNWLDDPRTPVIAAVASAVFAAIAAIAAIAAVAVSLP